MKKSWLISFATLIFLVLAAAAFAGATLTVTPDDMKNGDTKMFTDDGQKITVSRRGDDVDVKIEGAGKTKTITITKGDGTISIGRVGDGRRTFIIGPEQFEKFSTIPRMMPKIGRSQTWFVCPKDRTMLRVPAGKEGDTFKCPVDGTTMEKQKGRGFTFLFDDDFFPSEDL